MTKRRKNTDQFNASEAFEALRCDKTVQETAAKHQLHQNQVSTLNQHTIDSMADLFSGYKQSRPYEAEINDLHSNTKKLANENDFLSERLKK